MAQTIKENALEIVSANTNGFIRIVGENGLSYRVAVQDFINLVGNNQTITELIQEEALARESADNDLADEITDIKADLEHLSGVPTNVRQAILTLFESAAYTTTGLEDEIAIIESWVEEIVSISLNDSTITFDGSDTHQLVATTVPAGGSVVWSTSDSSVATVSNTGLVTSIGNGEATITASSGSVSATCEVTVSGFAVLESITAVYTQSGAVYDTDTLDDLKADLVVTATYDDSSTETVTDYTLSGTLEVGTSTITVTYGGKTDTFIVTVTLYELPLYDWDFTQSLVDSVSEETAVLGTYATRTNEGVVFTASNGNSYIKLTSSSVDMTDKTVEIDIPNCTLTSGANQNHTRFFGIAKNPPQNNSQSACLIWRYSTDIGWTFYKGSAWGGDKLDNSIYDINFFAGKTLKLYFDSDRYVTISYATIGSNNFTTIKKLNFQIESTYMSGYLMIGSSGGDNENTVTFSGVRIYDGEV